MSFTGKSGVLSRHKDEAVGKRIYRFQMRYSHALPGMEKGKQLIQIPEFSPESGHPGALPDEGHGEYPEEGEPQRATMKP